MTDKTPLATEHVAEITTGGLVAHWVRRLIHMSMCLLPLLYYALVEQGFTFWTLGVDIWMSIIVGIILIFEGLRLSQGWVLFAQRKHEARQLSSFAWGALAVALVLWLAPQKMYAIPIIWSCAFGDPFLGELRHTRLPKWAVFILGVLFVSMIWLVAHYWLGTSLWLAAIMGWLIVLAEWPVTKWMDDNASMQLVPLLLVLLLQAEHPVWLIVHLW